MKSIPFFVAMILILAACKSQQYTPDTYEKAQVIFGEGGGFTGAVNEYCLLDNGQLFHRAGPKGDYTEVAKLKRKEVKAIFSSLESEEMQSLSYNQPGNMYKFVEMDQGGQSQRIVWDPFNSGKLPQACLDLHKQMMALAPKAGGEDR